jgi:hypothetical protein
MEMQYALLIYESPEDFANRSADQADQPYIGAWRTYYRSMVDAGVYAGGQVLDIPETGTTVLHTGGKRQIQDGPYANTKEQLGGLVIMELPSLDAALEWASRCPAAMHGAVEVRPLAPSVQLRVTSVGADG